MHRSYLLLGIQYLLFGIAAATTVKACPKKDVYSPLKDTCFSKAFSSDILDQKGADICRGICMRADKSIPFRPGYSDKVTRDDYAKLLEACDNSHRDIIKVLEDKCACYGERGTSETNQFGNCTINFAPPVAEPDQTEAAEPISMTTSDSYPEASPEVQNPYSSDKTSSQMESTETSTMPETTKSMGQYPPQTAVDSSQDLVSSMDTQTGPTATQLTTDYLTATPMDSTTVSEKTTMEETSIYQNGEPSMESTGTMVSTMDDRTSTSSGSITMYTTYTNTNVPYPMSTESESTMKNSTAWGRYTTMQHKKESSSDMSSMETTSMSGSPTEYLTKEFTSTTEGSSSSK
ncbi:hypothetical protein H072_7771 [Dactylellina haptotyla CBS 200.50]|uniref:Uncharacterized protein n=1 Tax=Dactylellina haptotyla (strain CBS 200.50) TaxID=1284197 RepID=S8BGP9_DACHA|nr:hypothetical protein H072_7771 [Dactylellina haptotyla CBS 200.50]